jgi:hypothetical protein
MTLKSLLKLSLGIPERQAPRTDCPHDDWTILGSNRVNPPQGTCTKCGDELGLDVLLNNWKARIERELFAAAKGKQ